MCTCSRELSEPVRLARQALMDRGSADARPTVEALIQEHPGEEDLYAMYALQ